MLQFISHDYSQQSTKEDPRMMAFFDSLVQREIQGWTSGDSHSDPPSPLVSDHALSLGSTLPIYKSTLETLLIMNSCNQNYCLNLKHLVIEKKTAHYVTTIYNWSTEKVESAGTK